MGFITDIEKIVKLLPEKHQTLMFSATVTKEIEKLSKKYLNNPKHVKLASAVKPAFLRQTYYKTTSDKKMPLLISLLKNDRHLALVFCNTKRITDKLARRLSVNGVNAKCLHGDMSQPQRERVTNEFRHQRFSVLVATDVAARGLHIEDISHVYNYDIPKDVESYTHRVGRTARAGKKGEAISIVASSEEQRFFKQILFTYSGSITLKEANDADLIPLIDAPSLRPRTEFKKETGRKEMPRSGGYKKDSQKKDYPPRERSNKDFRRRAPLKKQSAEKEVPQAGNRKERPPFPSSDIKPKQTWKKRWQDLIGGK
jgi:ATP-dependent RNA helicase DeaD